MATGLAVGLSISAFGRVSVRRRDIDTRVGEEEIAWLEHEAASFDGHDGKIFDAWDMRETKGEPEHDILILNVLFVLGPFWQTEARFALVAVKASREILVGIIGRDPYSLASKGCAFVRNGTRFGQHRWCVGAHDLETDRFVRVRVDLAFIDDFPEPASFTIGARLRFVGILVNVRNGYKGIADHVIRVSDWQLGRDDVHLGDRVGAAVNHGVDTHTEQVSVVLRIDLRCHDRAIRCRTLDEMSNMGQNSGPSYLPHLLPRLEC